MKRLIPLTLLFASFSAQADADSEMANLAKLIGELDYFIQRVDAIAADAPKKQPYFRYDLLSKDMHIIRAGITEYFDNTLSVARDIKPLQARYIENEKANH